MTVPRCAASMPISGSSILLTENERDAKCREVTITTNDVTVKPIVVNLDKREKSKPIDIHPLLSNNAGLKSGCDYLLICPVENEKRIYFLMIELKSNRSNGWINQCIAGECLARYLVSTIDRVNDLKLDYEFVFRYINFKTNIKKRNTGTSSPVYEEDKNRQIHSAVRSCTATHNLKLFLR